MEQSTSSKVSKKNSIKILGKSNPLLSGSDRKKEIKRVKSLRKKTENNNGSKLCCGNKK